MDEPLNPMAFEKPEVPTAKTGSAGKRALPLVVEFLKFSVSFAVIIALALIVLSIAATRS